MKTMRSALKPPSAPQALPLPAPRQSGSSAAFLTCARKSMRSWPSARVRPPAWAGCHAQDWLYPLRPGRRPCLAPSLS